jgi:ribosomal protein S12 methylthiotransferase accessory factor
MNNPLHILGKDAALDDSIHTMQQKLQQLGFLIEEHSWLNPIPNVWSVHIRDQDCPLLFTNGKGASKQAALASALGEFFERLNCNYFFADFYLGEEIAHAEFVHYPNEKWFALENNQVTWSDNLLSPELWRYYDPDQALKPINLVDTNSGNQAEAFVLCLILVNQIKRITIFLSILLLIYMLVTVCQRVIVSQKHGFKPYQKSLNVGLNSK